MELLAHLAGDCAIWDTVTPEPRAAALISSTSTFPRRPQTGPRRPCGGSASLKAAGNGAPLQRRLPLPLCAEPRRPGARFRTLTPTHL